VPPGRSLRQQGRTDAGRHGRYGYPDDRNGDGCDTRAEVLIRESTTRAQVDPVGCTVVAGDWYSPYDDRTWTDPAEVQIDHVAALREAHDSGAWAWNTGRLNKFGNDLRDPRTLRAVTAEVNQAKDDADPSNWLPPNQAYQCTYLADWVAIKARWGLSMDESEYGRIRKLLRNDCPDQVVAPWPDTPPAIPTTTTTTTTTTTPPPIRPAVPPPPPPSNCDPSYPTACIPPPPPDLDCGDIPFDHFVVLPPDPHSFDGDGDGVGCES
jgi:Protein of unknown function (DUF1524)